MSKLVKKYPAISILILSNVLGFGLAYPVIAGLVPADSIVFLFAAYSASLSGVILAAIVSGKTGLKEMFKRLLIWRVGIGWWAFALFALIIMFLVGTVANGLFSGSTLVVKLAQPLYMFVPLFIMKFFLDAGLGEELGWRGFLLPRLQARHTALVASIIVGIVWGLWHVPLFMVEGMSPTYEFGQTYGVIPATLGHMVVITIPWAILFTWFYNNTKGSLLLAFVFHSSQAWFEIFRNPDNLFGPYYWYMGIMVVTAIIVVLVYGPRNLSRKHERIMIHEV